MADHPTERALQLLSLLQTHRFWPGEELTAPRRERPHAAARRRPPPVARLPGRRHARRRAAATASRPARTCRRCCSTTTKPSPSRSGCASAASASIDGMEDTALRALAKLEQVLPDRLRRRVRAVHTNVVSLQWSTDGPSVDADALAVLALGVSRPRAGALRLPPSRRRRRAAGWSSRTSSCRTGRRWYLVAWDVRRDDWRTFRLDRLERRAPRGCAVRAARDPRRRRGRVRRGVDPLACRCRTRRCSTSTATPTTVRAALRWSDAEVEDARRRSGAACGSRPAATTRCCASSPARGRVPGRRARTRRARRRVVATVAERLAR